VAAEIRTTTGLRFSDVFYLKRNLAGRSEAGEDACTPVKNTLMRLFATGECLAAAVLPTLV